MLRFKTWLEARFDPERPTSVPDGNFYAIKLRDGTVVYYPDADNHYDVIHRSRAAHKNIIATGWLDWGVFRAKPWGDPFQFRYEKENMSSTSNPSSSS